MREARPLHQACPHVLAPVSQGTSVHACLLTRPGQQGVGARPWTQRSLAKGRPSKRLGWAVCGAMRLALGLVLTGLGVQAADPFHRLSARRARRVRRALTRDTPRPVGPRSGCAADA